MKTYLVLHHNIFHKHNKLSYLCIIEKKIFHYSMFLCLLLITIIQAIFPTVNGKFTLNMPFWQKFYALVNVKIFGRLIFVYNNEQFYVN